MKVIRIFSRILVGIIFIYSGFVKAIDPLGFTYKLIDYFTAFNMDFFIPLALLFTFILFTIEFLIGVSMLVGIRIRTSSWFLLIFIAYFTLLTFIIALTNPVSDCGCFGDAIILSNWQTFWKNIIIMPFVLIIFISRKKYIDVYHKILEWSIIGMSALIVLIFAVHCLNHLPAIDFRPYNIGTFIPEKMEVPEGAPQDEYITYLYYEKDGVVKEFTSENYPWKDSTWQFVDSKSELVKEGYAPPIHDFTITSPDGNEITDLIIEDDGYSFLLITYNLEKASIKGMKYAQSLYEFCTERGYSFYCLTASSNVEIDKIKKQTGISYEFYSTDETTLKTIVRSNPGLLLLKEGIILNKWHHNDFPDINDLQNNLLATSVHNLVDAKNELVSFNYILWFLLLFSVFAFVMKSRS